MRRGEIWWASLPEPRGSEPGYRRPVLVVQSDAFVAAITSNLRLADAPGNVLLRKRTSRLPKDSVVNVSQLITVDRSFLKERVAELSPKRMRAVDEGLRLVLTL